MNHVPKTVIRCMVADDEPHALDLLTRHIHDTPGMELLYAGTRPQELLDMAAVHSFDLLFLDVEMPSLTGFDLVNLLQGKCSFILCSAHREYALRGYEHDISDYLLKPVTYNRFIKAVEKVRKQLARQRSPDGAPAAKMPEYILFKGDRKHLHLRICVDEIDYIEGAGHYVNLFVNGVKKMILMRMKQVIEQLPAGRFARVHHSYIVPLSRVTFVDMDEVGLKNISHNIPVSKTYREGLIKMLRGE